MHTALTVNLNHYNGTPPGTRRIGFVMPDGNERSAFVRGVENDWDASVFVDEATETIFFVGTSPDKRGLHVERWLNHHCPRKRNYTTKVAQKADLDNQDAGTISHAEIVTALQAELTASDNPQPIVKPPLELQAVPEHKTKRKETKGTGKYKDKVVKVERIVKQEGLYSYQEGDYGKGKDGKDRIEPSWVCSTKRGAMLMRTKGDPTWPRTVLHNKQKTEIFFLFTQPDGNYLLEALRETHTGYQRRETTAPKADFGTKKPATVVKTMADNLVYDLNAFA